MIAIAYRKCQGFYSEINLYLMNGVGGPSQAVDEVLT